MIIVIITARTIHAVIYLQFTRLLLDLLHCKFILYRQERKNKTFGPYLLSLIFFFFRFKDSRSLYSDYFYQTSVMNVRHVKDISTGGACFQRVVFSNMASKRSERHRSSEETQGFSLFQFGANQSSRNGFKNTVKQSSQSIQEASVFLFLFRDSGSVSYLGRVAETKYSKQRRTNIFLVPAKQKSPDKTIRRELSLEK